MSAGPSTITAREKAAPCSEAINIDEVLSQTCPICFNASLKNNEKFVTDCFHCFCLECILQFVSGKVRSKTYPINCPTCKHGLSPHDCISLLQDRNMKTESEQLSVLVIEYEIRENIRYCANKLCSTPFEWKTESCSDEKKEVCSRAFCPSCSNATCVQCRVPWHEGETCSEYERRISEKRNDPRDNVIKLNDLARRRNWKNCPRCNHLIEKIQGCDHMRCRCGHNFSYCSFRQNGYQPSRLMGKENLKKGL